MEKLSLERATEITHDAFRPYRTRVEMIDDGGGLEVRVADRHGNEVVDIDDIAHQEACDPERLAGILSFARDQAEARGFSLQPWSMPRQA